jgi:Tol biopolymer transport system component
MADGFSGRRVRVADFGFDENGVPSVRNVRDYRAQGDAFYEGGGFSPDGTKVVFTSDYLTGKWWENQIYRIDLQTSKVETLTDVNYNEHPSYTPDGRIIWMSGRDNKPLPGWLSPGTDWWLMDADGTHKERVTSMNERGQPGFTGHSVWAGTVTWSADGSRFIGDVQTNLITQQGKAVWVTLTCPT